MPDLRKLDNEDDVKDVLSFSGSLKSFCKGFSLSIHDKNSWIA
ncbi:hypothetical protein [Wielerella bovis]|nr:hypothetical protein [Wielerella bovis]